MKNSKLETLKTKKEQIEARIKKLESKERLQLKKQGTRRKILIGAFYMELMEKDEVLKEKLIARLDGFLTRPMDRELFGLPENGKTEKLSTEKKARTKTEKKPCTPN